MALSFQRSTVSLKSAHCSKFMPNERVTISSMVCKPAFGCVFRTAFFSFTLGNQLQLLLERATDILKMANSDEDLNKAGLLGSLGE